MIAETVVERQFALRPELRDRYGDLGWAKSIEDTEYHLAHLSGALLASSPALFADYISWAWDAITVATVRPEAVRENLVCLRDTLSDLLPKSMARAASSYVDSALRHLAEIAPEVPSFLPTRGPFVKVAAECLRLLLACDRHAASRLILDVVDSGMPIQDVYLQVIQPCQREHGRLWQIGWISVAQGHYCTAATQLIMSQLAPRLFATERNGRRAVITCVAGEAHDVGPRMVADLLELGGWDTIYFGSNVPIRGVVQALAEHRADLLAISATMTLHLSDVIDLIVAVRAEPACAEVKILVGGRLFDIEPDLWQRVGADGQPAVADEVCRLANRLVSERGDGPAGANLPILKSRRTDDTPALAPPLMAGDLYDELGRLNSEVVALNRVLTRKVAEVERLHAQVSRQAQDLVEADHRKDEFLALLGHELRNSLAPLRNALALLELDQPAPETVRWTSDIMGRQVKQMVRLVDDLLDVSRILQGKLDLRKERVELAAVVANAVETVRPVLDAKSHKLNLSLPDGPMVLDADPVRLAQTLTNLLINAAKYTDPGGRIVLTVVREGAEAVIVVRDNGVGIAPDQLPSIFDLYTQEARSLSRSQGGLGIGLTLVKNLVEMHSGSVSVRSEGLGRGSEFVIRLPASAVTAVALPPQDRTASKARWPHHRILVVDDYADAAIALSRMLTKLYGQEVRIAHDGPSAIVSALAFKPELMLLDIGLPGMDGYEVARRLREQPGTEGTLLVALTGWGQEEDRRKSREAGFDHHLVKPVEPEAILELLAKIGN